VNLLQYKRGWSFRLPQGTTVNPRTRKAQEPWRGHLATGEPNYQSPWQMRTETRTGYVLRTQINGGLAPQQSRELCFNQIEPQQNPSSGTPVWMKKNLVDPNLRCCPFIFARIPPMIGTALFER
jgi:hypothetical protein